MTEATHTSSGVQDLITRIRDEGVQAGKQEADTLLADARAQAASIVAEAKAQAAALHDEATANIDKEHAAALEALKIAARDAVLGLDAQVLGAFERHVRQLVSLETRDRDLVKGLVLALAGQAWEEQIKGKHAEVLIAKTLFEEHNQKEVRKRTRSMVLGLTREMLGEGIDLIPADDVQGGARVRLVGEDLEIDLTEKAIGDLILKRLLPRYRSILEGSV